MKKSFYAIAALAVLSVVAIAKAEYRNFPQTGNGGAAPIVWTGSEMSVATAGATGNVFFNPFDGQGVVQGVTFSSGACSSYVEIWDSTDSANVPLSSETIRIYNVQSGSTAPFVAGTVCVGQVALPIPLYLQKGLVWKGSDQTLAGTIVHFWKQQP